MAKASTYYRHIDGDEWFWYEEVEEAQVVETEWGEAQAEPGMLLMQAKEDTSQCFLVTPGDLEAFWTTEEPPEPAAPGKWTDDAPATLVIPPVQPVFPGDPRFHKDDRGPEGPPS